MGSKVFLFLDFAFSSHYRVQLVNETQVKGAKCLCLELRMYF